MIHAKLVAVLAPFLVVIPVWAVHAQVGTAQGDILRGQGSYLRGRGIYDLYSAQGRRIDAGTEIMIEKWNKQVYDTYMHERANLFRFKKNLSNAHQAEYQRKLAEKEERLRTSPTDQDVVSGDALNALLFDLANPSIGYSSWRHATVPLPPEVSIRSLFFRFAPRPGDRSTSTLSSNLIALGRLDPSRGWPIFIPADKVGAERQAYEETHRELLEQCEKDQLQLETVTKVDKALAALLARVSTAIPPERNFRATAIKYVNDMQAATKIFDASTIDFAQEMIRDTHDYVPQTVGELMAFLRKYRLIFASAEGRPDDGDIYRTLYNLLLEQKQKLGMDPLGPELQAAKLERAELAKLEGIWVLVRTFRDGKKIAAPTDPAKRTFLVLDATRYAVKDAHAIRQSGTWKFDAQASPKTLDRSGVGKAKNQPVTALGIYDWIEDGHLRICSHADHHPNEFKAAPNSGQVIQVWARFKQ